MERRINTAEVLAGAVIGIIVMSLAERVRDGFRYSASSIENISPRRAAIDQVKMDNDRRKAFEIEGVVKVNPMGTDTSDVAVNSGIRD